MASEVFDATGDGQPDVFVTNIYLPVSKENISESRYRNFRSLFENVLDERARGNNPLVFCGTDFDSNPCDLAPEYGIRKGGWGWAAVAADFDNDGDDDLFHTTQTVLRMNRSDPHYTYPMVWLREGDKFTTLNASATGFEETDGRGVVGFDYDLDGDIDLLVATHGGRYVLYENHVESRNSLEIVLRRPGPGSPMGAEVQIVTQEKTQTARLNSKADYQSQDSRILHFGVGDTAHIERVIVTWPDGTTTVIPDLKTGQRVVVTPGGIRNRLEFENDNESRNASDH